MRPPPSRTGAGQLFSSSTCIFSPGRPKPKFFYFLQNGPWLKPLDSAIALIMPQHSGNGNGRYTIAVRKKILALVCDADA